VVFGQVAIYEARGQYQIIVRIAVEDGVGRLQQAYEMLKAKLSAEGLFDPERKQAVPDLPERIVVITSPTGAALQDFLSILRRRQWKGQLILLGVRVQGTEAAGEIVHALELAQLHSLGDLIVLTRGGGSLEDLWAFNEEIVARAISACRLPIISAVGHEIDFSLSDFVADKRAETPSAAAELISSGFVERLERLRTVRRRMGREMKGELETRRFQLKDMWSRLKAQSPQNKIERGWLRLDDLKGRLGALVSGRLDQQSHRLKSLSDQLRLLSPKQSIEQGKARIHHLRMRLNSLGPEATLRRGFVIARDMKGRPVMDLGKIGQGSRIVFEFRDGSGDFFRVERATQKELFSDAD